MTAAAEQPNLSPSDGVEPAPARDPDAMPKWVPRAIVMFFAGAAAFLLARWLLAELRSLLITLLVSLFLSFAIEPAVNWLTARGWRRGTATWVVFLAVAVVSLAFLAAIATVLFRQLTTFVDSAPDYLKDIERWVNDKFDTNIDTDKLVDDLTDARGPLRDVGNRVAQNAVGFGLSVVGGVFQVFTVALFTWYLVADGPRLRRTILSVLPAHRQDQVLRTWELAIDKTGGYIYSRALLAAVSAFTAWIFLTIIGVPYPVPLALWVGVVSQFVPVIGTYLAGLMAVLVALLNDPVDGALTLGFVVAYQQVENYFLAPRITARTMELHPAVAFGTVITGAALLGPVGAVLALPAAAILQAFGSTLIDRHDVLETSLTAEPTHRSRWWTRRRREEPETT
ncbi:MAG TPA: AI-2E family transporter [Acidimicrobiales bacterium]|jgi:predicted PurR-regulated permease PerM